MKYTVKFTSKFKKDIKLVKKQGKNLNNLYSVIQMLADGKALPQKFYDHSLTGSYEGTRECHIEPDWLLAYEIIDDVLVLVLHRIGSHSQLF